MHLLQLTQYTSSLHEQGYNSVKDVLSISIEDLEDVGFFMLGHQKRLLLGIKRIKELRSGKKPSVVEYNPEEVSMSSLPPTLNSKQSFSSFHSIPGRFIFLFPPHSSFLTKSPILLFQGGILSQIFCGFLTFQLSLDQLIHQILEQHWTCPAPCSHSTTPTTPASPAPPPPASPASTLNLNNYSFKTMQSQSGSASHL